MRFETMSGRTASFRYISTLWEFVFEHAMPDFHTVIRDARLGACGGEENTDGGWFLSIQPIIVVFFYFLVLVVPVPCTLRRPFSDRFSDLLYF